MLFSPIKVINVRSRVRPLFVCTTLSGGGGVTWGQVMSGKSPAQTELEDALDTLYRRLPVKELISTPV